MSESKKSIKKSNEELKKFKDFLSKLTFSEQQQILKQLDIKNEESTKGKQDFNCVKFVKELEQIQKDLNIKIFEKKAEFCEVNGLPITSLDINVKIKLKEDELIAYIDY